MSGKKIWMQTELTCAPLDTLEEVASFLQNPPTWRSLCKDIVPHSQNALKNSNVNKHFGENLLETPQTFCHYNPDAEEVEYSDRKSLPKTLVCHDMANGYHDDSFVDGTGNYGAYTFYNWGAIDIFCYFSHHFITIPPLGWINVGHAHGVKVIGTIITEWGEGVEIWDRVLQSEVQSTNFASALVAIAKTLKFDGWLLNVENKIAKPQELVQFVRHLHTTLHQELDEPVLIWYDSVTVDGHLNWQNGLNQKNMAFFDAVDGFFTNYSWTVEDVQKSAEAAGERLVDLFIGIDVWGRNFYGGGQFNTQQAVQLAYNRGCSLAIFGQAWTWEALQDDDDGEDDNAVTNGEELDKYDKFLLRDRALWGSLWPFLATKLPSVLPFWTSFCRGQGKKRRLYGEVICPTPWYNLRHMQYQPNSAHGPHGYLLSSRENIVSLSRYGFLRSKAGILRYRRSLEMSRMDLADGAAQEVALSIKADSLVALAEEKVEADEERTSSKKRKIKDAVRSFFRIKAPKTEGVKETDAKEAEEAGEDGEGSFAPRGRSMVQMSVNLRLAGNSGKTKYALAYVDSELECLEPFYEDSFVGGSCLKVNPCDDVSVEHRLSRVFRCDFLCEDSLIACVVTKTLVGHEQQFLNVKLELANGREGLRRAVLVGRSVPHARERPAAGPELVLYPACEPADPEFQRLQRYMLLHEPDFYVSVENSYGWKVRYYALEAAGAWVSSVSARTGLDEGPVLLGFFGLCPLRRSDA